MKPNEIRNMTLQELEQKLHSLKEELFNLRYQAKAARLEKPSQIGKTRKDIARILTIMNIKERTNEHKAEQKKG